MEKEAEFWLKMMLNMLISLLVACGPGPSTGTAPSSRTSATKLPPGENLYVLDGYTSPGTTSTAQQIIAFHPGSPSPNKLLTLPAGLTSMDHRSLYIAASQGGQTTISVINTQSGATIRSLAIPGNYSTAGQSFANAVLSFDGQWLALRELGQAGNVTTIALVDTQAGKLVKTIHLDGNFDLDAVNPDGAALYLLQRPNDGSGHYYVELYNVKENELYQNSIVDKTQLDETRMTGTALARQLASDGTMAYKLYIDTFNNKAFVQILPLDPGLPFARRCYLAVPKTA